MRQSIQCLLITPVCTGPVTRDPVQRAWDPCEVADVHDLYFRSPDMAAIDEYVTFGCPGDRDYGRGDGQQRFGS
jgi:hypothetical protein